MQTLMPTPDDGPRPWPYDVPGMRDYRTTNNKPWNETISRALEISLADSSRDLYVICNQHGAVAGIERGRSDTDAMSRYWGSTTSSLQAYVAGWTVRPVNRHGGAS